MRSITFLLLCFVFASPAVAGEKPPIRVLAAGPEPFYFVDAQGLNAGYEHEILQSFAEAEGRELEVIWVERFSDVLPNLALGHGDIAAAALTITEERLRTFQFSAPYFPVMLVLVERRGEESDDPADLKGRRIATQKNSSYETVLREIDGAELVYLQPTERLFQAVAAGQADATAVDSSLFLWYSSNYPNLTLTLGLTERQFYGFALRPDDPLKIRLDAHIEHLKATGKLQEFLERAFGPWGTEMIRGMSEGFLD